MVPTQLEHDVVECVAPLAESHEIVEALEYDVLTPEIVAVSAVLDPVVGKRLLGRRNAAGFEVIEPLVDP